MVCIYKTLTTFLCYGSFCTRVRGLMLLRSTWVWGLVRCLRGGAGCLCMFYVADKTRSFAINRENCRWNLTGLVLVSLWFLVVFGPVLGDLKSTGEKLVQKPPKTWFTLVRFGMVFWWFLKL